MGSTASNSISSVSAESLEVYLSVYKVQDANLTEQLTRHYRGGAAVLVIGKTAESVFTIANTTTLKRTW
jgi:hypothetical protein